jgi:apolipoprotein D and lipocalin family protein
MYWVLFSTLFLVLHGCSGWLEPTDPPATVDHVDLERYMGTWYEIASLPGPFQGDCFCTKAQYSLLEGGEVEVLNSCRKGAPSGPLEVAKGRARVVPNTRNTKLEVEFRWPFKGNYWIIGLAPDYQWAIVGVPSRKYLWILSREPQMEEEALREALEEARIKGYHLEGLRMTDQSCWK